MSTILMIFLHFHRFDIDRMGESVFSLLHKNIHESQEMNIKMTLV